MTNPQTKLEIYRFVRDVRARQLAGLLPAAIGLSKLLRKQWA